MIAGRKAKAEYDVQYNLPANLVFVFERNADLEVESVVLKRLK